MKLHNLQTLRAIASVGVVMFHAQGMVPKYTGSSSLSGQVMDQLGGHGVDLFFVISGFIMRYAAPENGYKWWPFLRARLERIGPLYWLLTAVMLLVWLGLPRMFTEAPPDWARALRSLAFLSFSRGELPVIYVGWSLEYEMFFYLAIVYALIVSREPWKLVMTALSMAVIAGRLLQVDGMSGSALWIGRFLTDPILLEFVMGVWLAGRLATGTFDKWPTIFLASALISVLATEPLNRSLVVGIPAAMILWALIWLERERGVIVGAWLTLLGNASYSIYLVQVFTLSAAAKLVAKPLNGMPDTFVLVVVGLTVTAGVLCHLFVESPLLKLSKRLRGSSARPFAAAS